MKQNVNINKLKMVTGERVYGVNRLWHLISEASIGKPTLITKCSNRNIKHKYFFIYKKKKKNSYQTIKFITLTFIPISLCHY